MDLDQDPFEDLEVPIKFRDRVVITEHVSLLKEVFGLHARLEWDGEQFNARVDYAELIPMNEQGLLVIPCRHGFNKASDINPAEAVIKLSTLTTGSSKGNYFPILGVDRMNPDLSPGRLDIYRVPRGELMESCDRS